MASTSEEAKNGGDSSVEDLEALFKRYCLLGQGHGSKKTTLNQTQMNKLFMDSGIYKEFPKLDRNVLGIYWSYAFKKEKEIEYSTAAEGWKNVFADRYNIDSKGEVSKDDFWARFSAKLGQCKGPKLAATKVETAGVMDRLTDESKYTGMHKLRGGTQSAQTPAAGTISKPKPAGVTATGPRTTTSAKPATGMKTSASHHAVTTASSAPRAGAPGASGPSKNGSSSMTKSTSITRQIAPANGTR